MLADCAESFTATTGGREAATFKGSRFSFKATNRFGPLKMMNNHPPSWESGPKNDSDQSPMLGH